VKRINFICTRYFISIRNLANKNRIASESKNNLQNLSAVKLFFSHPTILSGNTTMLVKQSDFLEQIRSLIQSCIEEDRNAQRKMYELFAPKMFAVCLRYSKNREEAEDILQDGFVQVFKSLRTFKFAGSFEGWIRKIMVYSALASFRAKSKMHAVINIENPEIMEAGNREDVISLLGKKELMKLVQALPPMYRMVFNLYVFEGLKHREIAKELGVSEGTSKSNFFDAKVILQKAVVDSIRIANQNSSNG
jgi:RNA polymerase sigma-70 factor (ECF subfamily)